MKLRGMEFGRVIGAQGTFGFFGDRPLAYPIFRFLYKNSLADVVLATGTVTVKPIKGNMSFAKDGYTRKSLQRLPVSVWFGAGMVLSALGRSNPGLPFLLSRDRWQKMTRPFFISVAAAGESREARLLEWQKMAELFKAALPKFQTSVGLQIEFACPADGDGQELLIGEIKETLGILSVLGIPLVPVLSILIAPATAAEIARDPACDAVLIAGSIAWEDFPEPARKVFFRANASPYAHLGGGEVSGKYSAPLIAEWIRQARKLDMPKPLIADGGTLAPKDVAPLLQAGASAIVLGPVFSLRPWNVSRILRQAKKLFPR